MNNRRLLTGLLAAVLSGSAVCSYGQTVMSLDELFEYAETHSAQLRPAFTNQDVSLHEISVAKAGRLPDINANLS